MRQNWEEVGRKTKEDGEEVVVMEASLILHAEMAASLSDEDREKYLGKSAECILLNEAAEVYKRNGNLHDFVRDAGACAEQTV